MGAIAGFGLVVVGLVLPREVGLGFVALGLGLPGLMLQDACRFAFFSCGQAWKAVVNDGLWALLQVAALAALLLTDTATVFSCVLVFGGAATISAGLGVWQVGLRPRWTKARGWVVANIDLGARYLVENVSISGARAVPFRGPRRDHRVGRRGPGPGRGDADGPVPGDLDGHEPGRGAGGGTHPADLTGALGAARLYVRRGAGRVCGGRGVLESLGGGPGRERETICLGSLWGPAMALLPVVIFGMCLGGFSVSAAAGVRALGAARRSLRAQLIQSSAYLVGGIGGAYLGGARGTCIGVALATGFGAVARLVPTWVVLGQSIAPSWWAPLPRAGSSRDQNLVGEWARAPESVTPPRGDAPTGDCCAAVIMVRATWRKRWRICSARRSPTSSC